MLYYLSKNKYFQIKICVWHSIIGSALIDSQIKRIVDQWVFIGFCIIFVIMQLILLGWFFITSRHVRKLKNEEKIFLRNFHTHGENRLGENFSKLERL